MYWMILGNTPPANAVQVNGTFVDPIALPIAPSPCWNRIAYSYAYFAEVTGLVVPGPNEISGLDDSGPPPDEGFESEGVSLVVILSEGESATGACEVIVMDGNDTINSVHRAWENYVSATCPPGSSATAIFIGGDGQEGYDDQIWNGSALGDDDDFDCSDPRMPGAFPGGWDTDCWQVATRTDNTAGISIPDTFSADCVGWVATVLVNGECSEPTPVLRRTFGGVKLLFR